MILFNFLLNLKKIHKVIIHILFNTIINPNDTKIDISSIIIKDNGVVDGEEGVEVNNINGDMHPYDNLQQESVQSRINSAEQRYNKREFKIEKQ